MAFTTQELAQQMNHPNLANWANSSPRYQQPYLAGFAMYFSNLQDWITQHGGANPFGWEDVSGLTTPSGVAVVLHGPAQRAPFNAAFDDVRAYQNTPGFRLFQAAEAIQRLIRVLHLL
ncbi:hypothetical protein [Chitinolyticbacter albus]|uniref:hypothetical protein n=1 Tax=Chitinolyticbacter albus TaxID=2961951 RepID=UPI002109DE33|nr:hypothetical protein [Chitinolyticbacter albus]